MVCRNRASDRCTNLTNKKGSSAPPGHHTSAPHDGESSVNTVTGIGSADADQICHPAESPVSTDKSSQPVALHHPIAVEVSPVVPLSPASFATQAQIQVVGNANKPKFDRIETQLLR